MYYIKLITTTRKLTHNILTRRTNNSNIQALAKLVSSALRFPVPFFAIFLGWCHKPEFDIVRFALCGWFASVSAGNLALSASWAIVDVVVWCGDEMERG